MEEGYLNLNTLWFALIAVLWIGYFVLEGFDFGVGVLFPILGKTETDRRVMLNSIGPLWDANEVFLLVAGGATFAAFPEWYASLFSGFYLALFLILIALIFRGVAFEFRAKEDSPRWRAWWDKAIFWGSAIPALLWGVAFANIVKGVPIDAESEYVGSFFDLLGPYALLGGLTSFLLFTLHGAVFLTLKTHPEMAERARTVAMRLALPAAVSVIGFLYWTYLNATHVDETGIVPGIVPVATMGAALAVGWLLREKLMGWAFVTTSAVIALVTATLFLNLYPRVLVSSIAKANDLTIYNASSTHYTLVAMTIVAFVITPIVLIYLAWTYWTFRQRVMPPEPAGEAPTETGAMMP